MRKRFHVMTGSMLDNPHGVSKEIIMGLIDNNPPEMWAQTVFGKYVENSGLTFSSLLISNLFRLEPMVQAVKAGGNTYVDREWADQIAIAKRAGWANPYGHAIGVDLARKKDSTVITVLRTDSFPARCVYWRKTNRVPWPVIYAEIGKALHLFPGELLLDSTGMAGDVILEELGSRCYCPVHHITYDAGSPCPRPTSLRCVPDAIFRFNPDGYPFTQSSKIQLINHLQSCLGRGYEQGNPGKSFGAIESPLIVPLQKELTFYSLDDRKLETDAVMSLALAAWQGLEQQVQDPLIGSVYGD